MQNAIDLWQGLTLRRRLVVIGATLGMFLAVLALARSAATPGMALLYAGLDNAAAGEVVAALEKQGVPHEVRGSAIYVDQTQRDVLRLTLASEGLPGNNGTGYELLDGLSGFGTTAQMFDAAYWRAREGELARTIGASPDVRQARVHISQAPVSVFAKTSDPTASVSVVTASGTLAMPQARAIRHLVAAAVPGLQPENVSVIDSVAGLIDGDLAAQNPGASGNDRAEEIRRNLERLLSARVGADKAVVEVAVDLVTERESISERKLDPQGRVAISSESVTNSGSSTSPGGEVTVASNLPEGGAGRAGDQSQSNESRERVNYELSETQREVLREPGSIRRITVAVLVDGVSVTAADGTTTKEPRSAEELAALGELVTAAAGLDPARGDVLTLKSMDMVPVADPAEVAAASLFGPIGPIDPMGILQLAVLSVVALVLGLFVLRPLITRGGAGAAALPAPAMALALPGPGGSFALAGGASGEAGLALPGAGPVLTGEIADPASPFALTGDGAAQGSDAAPDPIERLRRLIEERQAESVEILRHWIEAEAEEV